MIKSTRTYTDFNEFVKNEPDAVKSLMAQWEEEGEVLMTSDYDWKTSTSTERPMESMEDLVEALRESGNSEEDVDSCYITTTYTTETEDGKFKFEVVGQSYRKDHSVCDEEMDQEVTVYDLAMLKAEKDAEKVAKAQADKAKWDEFFSRKTIDQIREELRENYKFPTKLK